MYRVYSKDGCPYCVAVEKVFKMKNIPYKKFMLDEDFTREDFVLNFGESTFPRVLDENANLIGGATETIEHLKNTGAI